MMLRLAALVALAGGVLAQQPLPPCTDPLEAYLLVKVSGPEAPQCGFEPICCLVPCSATANVFLTGDAPVLLLL